MTDVTQDNKLVSLGRALAVWVVIIVAESLHGIARVVFLQPRVGDFKVRQIAVFTGSAMILAIAGASVRWIGAARVSALLRIGLLWLGLTLGFEILLGRFLMRYSWEKIASDYNILKGGLLPIGLLVLTISPLLAARARRVILIVGRNSRGLSDEVHHN
jgi:hypothetical protein